MLGDFSFGDYFKNEIIPWSWEFVTKWLEIPEDKLYVTIYEEDDETGEIWHEKVGLPWDRIKKLGKEDNFWQHGTGPVVLLKSIMTAAPNMAATALPAALAVIATDTWNSGIWF